MGTKFLSPSLATLTIGSLGVVFGDIGTSPLYALQAIFNSHSAQVSATPENIRGILSMIIWCLIIIVFITYMTFITRALNDGEGGSLCLAALIERILQRKILAITILSAAAAALFYADSFITPAVSILGAIDGVKVINILPNTAVIPIALVLVAILFSIQRFGTGKIGKIFGPIMIIWFLVIFIAGIASIAKYPQILTAFSPHYAILFAVHNPRIMLIAIGGVALTVTGVEALYADMGHFGHKPILIAWTGLVFPALCANYLGQGALLSQNPDSKTNPFFLLLPEIFRTPMLLLAACATFIASQAVISGVFSAARQASRMSLLPRLHVVYTSRFHAGQIYIPSINAILFLGVTSLILIFKSTENLSNAYGLAVSTTLLIELILFCYLARKGWNWKGRRIIIILIVSGIIEFVLFFANLIKIPTGAWLPLVIAGVIGVIMFTWRRGSSYMFGRRKEMEGPLDVFIEKLKLSEKIRRVPGVAIYLQGNNGTTPLAMKSLLSFQQALQENVLILHVITHPVPYYKRKAKITIDSKHSEFGIYIVKYHIGFNDSQSIPEATRLFKKKMLNVIQKNADIRYILSVYRIEPGSDKYMPRWQKRLFRLLEKFSANRTQVFKLPRDRTIIIGAETQF